jgi:ribosome-associated toxin RatA of RatAB toxin-antitoxin module
MPLSIYLLAFFLSLSLSPVQDKEWKKSLDKDDIIIYTRKVESSPFLEFLAEAEMKGTVKKFGELITDFEHYPELLPDCESAEVMQNPAPNEFTYHMKLKVPFPFTKRDLVQQLVLHRSADKIKVEITNRPHKMEVQKNFIRILRADGRWEVQQISEEKISIKFQYLADPGGGVPPWLVNTFIVNSPYKTLRIMRKMMQE